MKIVATADNHGNLPHWPEDLTCDLAIFAGDVCPDWSPESQRDWLKHHWMPYLQSLPAKEVVWIWGNHDFIGDPGSHRQVYMKEPPVLDLEFLHEDPRIHLLTRESVEIQGFKVYGYPYVGHLHGWAFVRDDEVLDLWANEIPSCDILVTHAPIHLHGDRCMNGDNAGDPYLLANIERINPRVVFCGHIHEGFGMYRHEHVPDGIFSVSHVDHRYKPRKDSLVEVEL